METDQIIDKQIELLMKIKQSLIARTNPNYTPTLAEELAILEDVNHDIRMYFIANERKNGNVDVQQVGPRIGIPASPAQLKLISDLHLIAPANCTSAEASRLIQSKIPPKRY